MGRKYDFELQYLKNQLAHEGQWWLVLLDFSCSFVWAQLVLSPEFPFKQHDAVMKKRRSFTKFLFKWGQWSLKHDWSWIATLPVTAASSWPRYKASEVIIMDQVQAYMDGPGPLHMRLSELVPLVRVELHS